MLVSIVVKQLQLSSTPTSEVDNYDEEDRDNKTNRRNGQKIIFIVLLFVELMLVMMMSQLGASFIQKKSNFCSHDARAFFGFAVNFLSLPKQQLLLQFG